MKWLAVLRRILLLDSDDFLADMHSTPHLLPFRALLPRDLGLGRGAPWARYIITRSSYKSASVSALSFAEGIGSNSTVRSFGLWSRRVHSVCSYECKLILPAFQTPCSTYAHKYTPDAVAPQCMHAFSHPTTDLTLHFPLSFCRNPRSLIHGAQQLRLQDEFPLLVLLTRLVCLVVLPPHRVLTLPARYIPHNMPASGHIPFRGVSESDVHDGIEEVSFAMLTAEIL